MACIAPMSFYRLCVKGTTRNAVVRAYGKNVVLFALGSECLTSTTQAIFLVSLAVVGGAARTTNTKN